MTIVGNHHETTCPVSQCPPEIQRVVHADFDDDLSRLTVGQQLVAYVESGNRTETWEVVQAGTTLDTVMLRLIDSVQESSAA